MTDNEERSDHQRRHDDDELAVEVASLREKVSDQATLIRTRLHPARLALMLTAATTFGVFLPKAMEFVGIKTIGPGLKNQEQDVRIGNVEVKVSTLETILSRYVVSNCLDSAQIDRLRKALVPCARLMYEQGIQFRPETPP